MEEQLKKEVKSLQIVYGALIIGVIFFMAVSLFLNISKGRIVDGLEKNITNILLLAVTVIGFTAIVGGIYVFNIRTKGIKKLDIGDKLVKYRSAMIIRAAAIEAPAFIFTVIYMLTGSNISLAEVIIVLAVLIYFFPSKERLSKELNINLKNIN